MLNVVNLRQSARLLAAHPITSDRSVARPILHVEIRIFGPEGEGYSCVRVESTRSILLLRSVVTPLAIQLGSAAARLPFAEVQYIKRLLSTRPRLATNAIAIDWLPDQGSNLGPAD